uniref:hypothetical protein n=1 Tax=Flavobacterium sp. TaxID=239 RepID=UPI0040474656
MRKIIVMLALVVANFVVEAQVKTPQSSPSAKVEQVVGLTTVQVEYSRPSSCSFSNIIGNSSNKKN